jgi:predicted ATP-grasp superfamily ATP-dependent carboligase
VLIPCADDWQLATSGLPPALAGRFPTSGPPLDSARILVDKGRLSVVLQKLGIPHPRTIPWPAEEGLPAPEASFFADYILKPRISKQFQLRFGTKGYRCRDRSEVEIYRAEILDSGLQMVLQEYIPGPPTAHYFIDGFIDRSGITCARFARQRLRMYPPDLGNSTLMISVPLSAVRPAAEALDLLLAALHYRGTFSAEFKQDERDGVFKLIEVNCRHWWYVGFAASCGVDVTWMTYQDALGNPVPPIEQYRVGARCVHPHCDRYACLGLRRDRQLSLWSWAESWLGSRQPILTWDDPGSALTVFKDLFHRRGRRSIKT